MPYFETSSIVRTARHIKKKAEGKRKMHISAALDRASSGDTSSIPRPIQQTHKQDSVLSPGAWIGISICILVCLACILRYSYLASPFWFLRIKRGLGFRPSNITPISHVPIYTSPASLESCIIRPDPALLHHLSKEGLPPILITNRFSTDILDAVSSMGTTFSTKPPSDKSKRSAELRHAMEEDMNPSKQTGEGQEGRIQRVSEHDAGSGQGNDAQPQHEDILENTEG